MTAKRHLPVLPTSSRDEGPNLTAVQWVLLGALVVFVLFLPLGMLGLWASSRVVVALETPVPQSESGAWAFRSTLAILPLLAAFALSTWGGAAVVGRYASGGRASLPTYAGLLAATLIVALAFVQGALRPLPILGVALSVLLVLAAVFSSWGGRIGRRFRA